MKCTVRICDLSLVWPVSNPIVIFPDKPTTVTVTPSPAGDRDQGDDVTFTCESDGFPSPSYIWKHNGADFNPVQDKKKLSFFNLDKNRAGNYTCIASNRLGSKQHLVVLNVKCKFLDFTFVAVSLCSFPCHPWYLCNSMLVYRVWDLHVDLRLSMPSSWCSNLAAAFILHTVAWILWLCTSPIIFHRLQYKHSSLLCAYLADAPEETQFSTGTPNSQVIQGTKVTLTCTAEGYPPPRYDIRRNNAVAESDVSPGIHTIGSVQLSDDGVTFDCVARNEKGSGQTQSLVLTVLGKCSIVMCNMPWFFSTVQLCTVEL